MAKGLSTLSRNTIGDVFAFVKQKEEEVGLLEQIYEDNNTDSNRQSMHKAQVEYTKWLKMQDFILKQKVRIMWADEGDTNSKYLYSMIKNKRKRTHIHRINNNQGSWIEGNEAITDATIEHFSDMFTHNKNGNNMSIIDCVDQLVTDEYNELLNKIPDDEEIK